MLRRKIMTALGLLYFMRKAYRHARDCLRNDKLVAEVANMAVYTVSEVKELLEKSPPGHKVYCFVRGLITSKNAFESILDQTKKLVWSIMVKAYIYSNRPKQIIDTLDVAGKIRVLEPRVVTGLCLLDFVSNDKAQLIASQGPRLNITTALSEIAVKVKKYPTSLLQSIRSFFAKIMRVVIIIGRLVKGAPIKKVLIELGMLDGGQVLILGNWKLSDSQGLLVEAEVATKDIEAYVKRLSAMKTVYLKQLGIVLLVLWMFVAIFSRDIIEAYESVVGWLRGPVVPSALDQQQHSDSEDNTFSCYICYSKVRCMVFMPCKHYGVCRPCYHQLESKLCPTCKTEIESVIEVCKQKQ